MKWCVSAAFLCLVFLGTACGNNDGWTTSELDADGVRTITPQNLGEGVYYFPANQAIFGASLTEFKKKNPSFRILAIAVNPTVNRNSVSGYFVVVEKKEVCECNSE